MAALVFGGRLPADGVNAQRTGAAEHVAHGAVLAGGVGALQHHQQLVAAVGEEQVLQAVKLLGKPLDLGLVSQLVAR